MGSEAVRRPPRRAMVQALLLLPLLLLAAPCAAAAALKAEVINPPVNLGDTFELLVSLLGRDSLEPPNTAPLARDFDILDRVKAGRSAMVDGRETPVTLWLMTLAPKRAGRLTIPALSVGSETTAPIQIVVAPGPVAGPPDDGPVSIRVDVAGTPPYFALSDIPVRVRVFDRVGAATSEPPPPPIADGMPLAFEGAWRSYSRTFGSQRYRIIERRYVLRPQREGVVTILPVPIVVSLPPASATDAPRRVELRSSPVEVTVEPRPDGVAGWFLPARAVMLTRVWSSPLAQARVGGALTSTITLAALGASANQLPSLAIPEVEDVRQYAEETKREPAMVDGAPGAMMEMRVSVVPTQAGTVTLPALSVPWWNTQAGRVEMAVLPEQTFTVAPSAARPGPAAASRFAGSAATRAVPPMAAAPAAGGPPVRAGSDTGAVAAEAPDMGTGIGLRASRFLQSLVAGGMREGLMAAGGAVVIAMGVFIAFRLRRPGTGPAAAPAVAAHGRPERRPAARPVVRSGGGLSPGATAVPGDAAVRALEAACRAGDAAGAHRAYLAWRRSLSGAAPGAAPLTPEMTRALQEVSRHLYGSAAGGWEARDFRKAFAVERRAARRGHARASAPRLAPLYPGAR